MNMSKLEELKLLDEACETCLGACKTLKTNGMALDYHIQRQADRCERAGATRQEVDAILNKYMNVVRLPRLSSMKRS